MHPQLSPKQRSELAVELQTRIKLLESRTDNQQENLPRVEYARQELLQDADDVVQRDGDYEVEAVLSDLERHEIAALHSALRRLDEGAYGLCVACGQAIPFERLTIEPDTLRCRDCETASERSV